jgi:hypothetical protein
MSALAAGALWCLLALRLDSGLTWLILPVAVMLALILRWHRIAGWRGGAAAVVATLLAFAYVQYLFAAVRIAQLLGFPLRSTLFKMDFALGWQVIRAHLGMIDCMLLLLALVLAGLIACSAGKRAN